MGVLLGCKSQPLNPINYAKTLRTPAMYMMTATASTMRRA